MNSTKHTHGEIITTEIPAVNIAENNKSNKYRLRRIGAGVLLSMATLGVGAYSVKEISHATENPAEINRDEIAHTYEGKFGSGEGGIKALNDTLAENGISAEEIGINSTYEGQELQQVFGGNPQAGDEFLVHQMNDGDLRFEKLDK